MLTIEAVMASDVLSDETQPLLLGTGTQPIYETVGLIAAQMGEDASAAAFCEAVRDSLFAH
jgi:hypothetical protein